MVHLLHTPIVFVLVGPPIGTIATVATQGGADGGFMIIFGCYILGAWPALVAGTEYIALSFALERILRRSELHAVVGGSLGAVAGVGALMYCFPADLWWQFSKVAREMLVAGVLGGAASGVLSSRLAAVLARDMSP